MKYSSTNLYYYYYYYYYGLLFINCIDWNPTVKMFWGHYKVINMPQMLILQW